MVMCLHLRKRLIQLGLFIQKDDKTRYYRNISQLLGPILLLLILMPKQRLISTEAETIMSHSKGRQQKKYFGLSQCFPILQANSASDEFSKKDYTDSRWIIQMLLPERKTIHMLSQILTIKSRQNTLKNMLSWIPALFIYILIFLYTASFLLGCYANIWESRFLNSELNTFRPQWISYWGWGHLANLIPYLGSITWWLKSCGHLGLGLPFRANYHTQIPWEKQLLRHV